MAAQNLRRINKEKDFTPLGLKKCLHGMTDLTGSISEKRGRGIFFFCLSSYTGLPKERKILLRSASKQAKTKLGPVRPCVQIWEPGRGVGHQQDPKPAPLEPCEAVVDESSKLEQPKIEQKPAPPPLGGGVSSFWRENQNSAPCSPVCGFGGRVGERHQGSSLHALLETYKASVEAWAAVVKSHRRKSLKEWMLKNKVLHSKRHIHKKLRIKSWT